MDAESAVFRSPSGLVRLDIPRDGSNLRELHDAKVASGDLVQVPDDSVREERVQYGADKSGEPQYFTRLVEAEPAEEAPAKRERLSRGKSLAEAHAHEPPPEPAEDE